MRFTESERRCFRYHDGRAEQLADPLDLLRRLTARERNLGRLVRMASTVSDGLLQIRQAIGAQEQIGIVVREVFGLADFDPATGTGALEGDVLALWESFCGYLTERKDSMRRAADRMSVYGIEPEPFDYHAYVGLELNLDRQRWWNALMTAHGSSAAMTSADLPAALLDPVAGSDEEAEDMAFDANAERRFQAARQQARHKMMGA